jgi:hypothetical protein
VKKKSTRFYQKLIVFLEIRSPLHRFLWSKWWVPTLEPRAIAINETHVTGDITKLPLPTTIETGLD